MAFETIKIEDYSGSQVIKIPEDFRINDNKVYVKKIGNSLYLIPFHNPWQSMIDSIDKFSSDFLEERENLNEQKRESLD